MGRFKSRSRAVITATVSALCVIAIHGSSAQAQLSGQIAEKPIAVGYARDIGPLQVMDYATNLMTRLNIGEQMRKDIASESLQEQKERTFPKVEHPLYGVAWYMVTGLIPSFESVSFQQVVDEADARRLVDGRKQQWGDQGTLEDLGNGCFKVHYRSSYTMDLPPEADESAYINQNQGVPTNGWKNEAKIVEKDGKRMVEQTTTMINLFRLHDNMLYEATFDELFTMTLPSASDITSGVDGSTDLGFDAYLDRIPQGIRMLGWNLLSSAVGTQLQQRDDEPEASYNARRTGGDLGLALTKAVLFDVDHSEGWLRFASGDEPSLRGELRVRARNNSALSKQLLETAGVSRFAPILSDNAAVTAHLCARLPEEAPPALIALGDWFRDELKVAADADPAMMAAGDSLVATLAGIAEHRNLELLLKIGWSQDSGGVFYGGLQLHDDPNLLKSIHHFLLQMPAPVEINDIVQLVEVDGLQMIRIQFPSDATDDIRRDTGMTITHVWLAHDNSCLWFAAGTEQSKEIIRQSIARCSDTGRAARTPLVSLKIDMERWLSYPQDDPAGIAQLPWYLDENSWWFPPSPMASFGGIQASSSKPTPIMHRVFELGGAQQFWLTVETDESGILLQSSLGLALANHMIARMVDSQEQMMKQMQINNERMAAESAKALEEAQKALPAPPAPPAP